MLERLGRCAALLILIGGFIATPAVAAGPSEHQPPSLHWGTPTQFDRTQGGVSDASCPTSSFCMAVDGNGTYLEYDNGVWSQPAVNDARGSVACASASFCIQAADHIYDSTPSIATFDGTSWTTATTPAGNFLQASCVAGNFCAEVSGASLATFDGTNWSALSDPGGLRFFDQVSCVTATFCMAFDAASDQTVVWNGKTWKVRSTLGPPGTARTLSCASKKFCVTGSSRGEVMTFDGTTWSAPQLIDAKKRALDVSCTSRSFCMAKVGDGPYLYRFTGTTWHRTHTSGDGGTFVDCAGRNFCLANVTESAGPDTGDVSLWDGTAWGAPQVVNPPQGDVSDLSCADEQFCAAVDSAGNLFTHNGAGWSAPDRQFAGQLDGADLSCASKSFCLALAGDLYVTWNGQQWSTLGTAPAGSVYTLSCPSDDACVAGGIAPDAGAASTWTFDGQQWSPPTTVPGLNSVDSLSCTSLSFCVATTYSGAYSVFSAGTWSPGEVIDDSDRLGFVSCVSPTFCQAGDEVGSGENAAIETFDGSGWQSSGSLFSDYFLILSCASVSFCTAVTTGYPMTARTFDGSGWSDPVYVEPGTGAYDRAVSCVPGSCFVLDDLGQVVVGTT